MCALACISSFLPVLRLHASEEKKFWENKFAFYPTFIHTHYRKPQNRCEWEHNICMEAQGKQNRVETWPP